MRNITLIYDCFAGLIVTEDPFGKSPSHFLKVTEKAKHNTSAVK